MTTPKYPGGMGPWFVSLLLNVSTKSKKQTHLIAHTYPQLAADALNKTSGKGKAQWMVVSKIGPFNDWDDCLTYLDKWVTQTRGHEVKRVRGQERHLKRGREVFEDNYRKMGLTMWTREVEGDTLETLTSRLKDSHSRLREHRNSKLNKKRRSEIDNRDVFASGHVTIGSIMQAQVN